MAANDQDAGPSGRCTASGRPVTGRHHRLLGPFDGSVTAFQKDAHLIQNPVEVPPGSRLVRAVGGGICAASARSGRGHGPPLVLVSSVSIHHGALTDRAHRASPHVPEVHAWPCTAAAWARRRRPGRWWVRPCRRHHLPSPAEPGRCGVPVSGQTFVAAPLRGADQFHAAPSRAPGRRPLQEADTGRAGSVSPLAWTAGAGTAHRDAHGPWAHRRAAGSAFGPREGPPAASSTVRRAARPKARPPVVAGQAPLPSASDGVRRRRHRLTERQ